MKYQPCTLPQGPGDGRNAHFWLLIIIMSKALTLFSVLHTLSHEIHKITYQYWYFSSLSNTATPTILAPIPWSANTNARLVLLQYKSPNLSLLHDAAKLSFLICNKSQIPFNDLLKKKVHSSWPWDFLNSFPILSLSQSVCSSHNATVVLHTAWIHLSQNPCYVHSLSLLVLTTGTGELTLLPTPNLYSTVSSLCPFWTCRMRECNTGDLR